MTAEPTASDADSETEVELAVLKREFECAKKATAELPAWKREVIRRTRAAEVALGYAEPKLERL